MIKYFYKKRYNTDEILELDFVYKIPKAPPISG